MDQDKFRETMERSTLWLGKLYKRLFAHFDEADLVLPGDLRNAGWAVYNAANGLIYGARKYWTDEGGPGPSYGQRDAELTLAVGAYYRLATALVHVEEHTMDIRETMATHRKRLEEMNRTDKKKPE